MTRIAIAKDSVVAGEFAADLIIEQVDRSPETTLGIATGSTPATTWTALRSRGVSLSGVTVFALDEYLGLPSDHPQSYKRVIEREVVGPLGISRDRTFVPSAIGDPKEAAFAYERNIRKEGGVDLQVLGIGRNGHIGFNEPGSSLAGTTRVVTLSEQTRRDNSRFFPDLDAVPRRSITQGIGTILRARRLILLAFGEHKASAVTRAVEGPVTSAIPASAIQLHPDATVIIDRAAASMLTFTTENALLLG